MLVLARKIGEKIILNDNIEIIILDSNPSSVRIGINAPKDVTVYREELYKEIKTSNISSNNVTTSSVYELQDLVKNTGKSFTNQNFANLVNKINK